MPVTSTFHGCSRSRGAGSGSAAKRASSAATPSDAATRSFPPSIVTKLGQWPLRHEKSLLQLDWLMRRLRPNSVSIGSIEMQFDCTLQSPQPSHTSSLITTRRSGSGNSPRLRSRRASAAQVWS